MTLETEQELRELLADAVYEYLGAN